MIIAPSRVHRGHHGAGQSRGGELDHLHYLSPERVELVYQLPLADVVFDFFGMSSRRTVRIARLRAIRLPALRPGQGGHSAQRAAGGRLLDDHPCDKAAAYGRRMVERLRELIPRQLFDVPVQAASGGRIIARDDQGPPKGRHRQVLRGDITRKRKRWSVRRKKKRMKMVGSVEVPQKAFIAALKVES